VQITVDSDFGPLVFDVHESGDPQGQPVLLLHGFPQTSHCWRLIAPQLQGFRVLQLDQRGYSPGARPGDAEAYRLPQMVGDALAVLDAVGVEKAHVVGISMGGLMAQELAISHPERVQSLVLMATHPGIAHSVLPQEVIDFLTRRATMTPEEGREASIPFNYAETTSRETIEEDWAVREKGTASQVGYAAQGGTALWSGLERLPQITAPTLVMYGDQDRLVVPANSEKIAEAIPGAQLLVVPNANHVLTTDQADIVNNALLDWFAAHEAT
jgi:pimeloyl-ACP methyl ester carboxylesterase